LPFLTPIRRLPNEPLTEDQDAENIAFSAIRSRIEQTYGQWKQKFESLSTKREKKGYKEAEEYFEAHLKFDF